MFWIIILGLATGMRTMTPMAVFCWVTWFAMVPVTGLTFWTANIISVVVFTALALGEYYGDTLPRTPNRTATAPLLTRLVFAALIGSLASSSLGQPLAGGILFAIVGVLLGIYGGYFARLYFAKLVGRDLPVALCESALALGLSLLSLHEIARDIKLFSHIHMIV